MSRLTTIDRFAAEVLAAMQAHPTEARLTSEQKKELLDRAEISIAQSMKILRARGIMSPGFVN